MSGWLYSSWYLPYIWPPAAPARMEEPLSARPGPLM
eukprot:COSAG04_NODE_16452_length_498_cov_1.899749_2_plen_35_part_01